MLSEKIQIMTEKCSNFITHLFIVLDILLCSLSFPGQSVAQTHTNKMQEFFSAVPAMQQKLSYVNETKEFYTRNGFTCAWLSEKNKSNFQMLLNYFNQSADLGLEQNNYVFPSFSKPNNTLHSPASQEDSIHTDIAITDAAIHFFHDVAEGNQTEDLLYNGLNYSPDCNNIGFMLFTYLNSGKFSSLLSDLQPQEKMYESLKKKLQFFQKIISIDSFENTQVKSLRMQPDNKPLLRRLYQLGFLSSDTLTINAVQLKDIIKEVQNTFNQVEDGELRIATLEMLNVPISTRIAELKSALNALRWISCIRKSEKHIIVVNIPSTTLLLCEHDQIMLESKIVAGKKSTPTPTLCSKINEVILYPYWNVPNKIATRELLPLIKKNPKFLEENAYQVLNKQAKIIDPLTINWEILGKSNFPYTIRQSTGCDNSLGLVKLNFYNPYTVYLHDTPFKNFFNFKSRFFSHGCMRVEKAFDLARFILKNNRSAIDTLPQKGCLKNVEPIRVAASEIIPVFVIYHTAWADSSATVRFYPDIYKKFSFVKNSTR
jgi:murein L,D-transpeptidase YcbB/YkuD